MFAGVHQLLIAHVRECILVIESTMRLGGLRTCRPASNLSVCGDPAVGYVVAAVTLASGAICLPHNWQTVVSFHASTADVMVLYPCMLGYD